MSKAFSVIVPCFNRADLVSATIDSLLQQILPPVEIIIVDDGSTDNLAEVVQRYGNAVRFVQISNCGAAGARHAGVQASRCEYIAFCDSDDVWMPDHLQSLATVLEMQAVEFVFSNFCFIQDGKWTSLDKFSQAPSSYWKFAAPLIEDKFAVFNGPMFPHLLEFQPIFPSCTGMSRRFYDEVGGYNIQFGRLCSEDLEFTLRCVCKGSVGIVFRPTVGYRLHADNHLKKVAGNKYKKTANHYLGETLILEYSRDHHPIQAAWIDLLDKELARRSLIGFDMAFIASEFKLTRHFSKFIPVRSRSTKFHLKRLIASLPESLAAKFSNKLAGPKTIILGDHSKLR